MDEIVNTYLLSDPETLVPMSRKEFYAEQIQVFKDAGKPSRAVEVINILIFNQHKEVLLQKRSYDKAHNPGLIDKSIGGHIRHGDSPDYTVMVETLQELQTPSIVLKDKEDFHKTLGLLKSYSETIAIIQRITTRIFSLAKLVEDETITIANKSHIYFGFYNGRIRPVDREAKGVLYYSLDELRAEMAKLPNAFTQDLHVFMKEFSNEISEFLGTL
jgi:isopentenyldiphosphate isomerase